MSLATHPAVTSTPPAKVKNRTVTLSPPTILDISMCREFWEIAQQARDSEIKVIIDLQETVSIHDSGYTLLWMLKESLAKERTDLLLLHCRPHLKKALWLHGFDPHFTIL